MQKQTLLWTLLPNGRSGNLLRFSALLSPRLSHNEPSKQKLLAWTDFWNPGSGHWPAKVTGLSFKVKIGGVAFTAVRVGDAPDSALWGRIFAETTPVKSFEFADLSQRPIRSFPVMDLVEWVDATWGKYAGAKPTDMPTVDGVGNGSLRDFLDFFADFQRTSEKMKGEIEGKYNQFKGTAAQKGTPMAIDYSKVPAEDRARYAFYHAMSFYDRPKDPTKNKYQRSPSAALLPQVPNRPDVQEQDFHGIVAALSDYGRLLRRLGIVVDLEVDISGQSVPGSGLLELGMLVPGPFAPYTTATPSPRTQYILSSEQFLAAPKPNDEEIADGYLRLDAKGRFAMIQLDPDGTALKTINAGSEIRRMLMPAKRSFATPKRTGLPALRSTGFSIVRNGRGMRTAQQLGVVRNLNDQIVALSSPTLWAEDVMRGYRVDVQPVSESDWYSLCRRDESYKLVKSGDVLQFEDQEGYVKSASAAGSYDGSYNDMYLHEVMFGWEGWSLCVAHPGKTIVQDFSETTPDGTGRKAKLGGGEYPEFARNTPDYQQHREREGFRVEPTYNVHPGTLPALRFGQTYGVRARVADLAGNSIDHRDKNWRHSIRATYLRYDPVIIPAVVPRTWFTEGESLEHCVIRSNYDKTTEEYVAQDYINDLLTGKGYDYLPTNDRFLAPPKISQLMSELHGMFDPAMGEGKDYKKWFNVARREEGTFMDRRIVDMNTGEKTIPAVGITLITPPGVPAPQRVFPPDPTPDPLPPPPAGKLWLNSGDPFSPGQYVVHNTDKLLLPYLPDPLARGVALRGLPGVINTTDIAPDVPVHEVPETKPVEWVALVPWIGDWPEIETFRMIVKEGSGIPKWDASTRSLIVFLPKGDKVRVRFSSYIGKDQNTGRADADLMKVLQLVEPGRTDIARLCAERGVHWMITPARTFELVHALQQPLIAPTPDNGGSDKFRAEKRATGIGDTYAEVGGMINLSTKSTVRIDVLAKWDEPVDNIVEPEPTTLSRKAHVVDFTLDEFYIEQYPDKIPLPLPVSSVALADAQKEGARFRHEFGDTKYRRVEYYLKGTTRFREYLPVALWNDPVNKPENDNESDAEKLKRRIHRIGASVTRDIYNSARPLAPKILYVIPTFGWDPPERTPTSIVSRRCGNGLRVYMERPWYSSGAGELVGVVLRRGAPPIDGQNGSLTKDPMKPYVTMWGQDPIWGSTKMSAQPKPSDFRNVTAIKTNVSLDEMPGTKVDVVGFEAHFDPARRLWYADIELDPGTTYYPFIRLALCRFHPKSIADCHISRVILNDFAQVAPDRVAAVVASTNTPTEIKVMVSGYYGVNQLTKTAPIAAPQAGLGNFAEKPSQWVNLDLSRVLLVTVETRSTGNISANDPTPPATPWHAVSADLTNVELDPTQESESKLIWLKKLTLPEAPGQDLTKSFRLQIREYELLPTDPDVGKKITRFSNEYHVAMRLVYADTIMLNG